MAANDRQEGGDHYKTLRGMEPWDVITFWGLGFLDGNAVKYLSRWRKKNGLEDLKKARHYLDKLIEQEEAKSGFLRPVLYNELEGEKWQDWPGGDVTRKYLDDTFGADAVRVSGHTVHAFTFSDGRVWDCHNGWRDAIKKA